MMDKILRTTEVVGSRKLSKNSRDGVPRGKGKENQDKNELQEGKNSLKAIREDTVFTENMGHLGDLGNNVNDKIDAVETTKYDRLMFENLLEEKNKLEQKVGDLKNSLEQKANSILEEKEKAKDKGYQEGLRLAEKSFDERVEATLKNISALEGVLESSINAQIAELEELAIQVGYAALCRLVGEEFSNKDCIKASVKSVLSELNVGSAIVIRVNPDQLEVLEEARKELADTLNRREFQLVADSRVLLGGCIVETSSGNWDGRLETQLQKLIEARNLS